MTLLDERTNPAGQATKVSPARRAMIDSQLRVSGVNDPAVLAAIGTVAREDFVPAAQKDHAYIDRALPLGDGQALPAPLVQGLLLTQASPAAGERVIVVSPCGYLGAVVAALGCAVTTLSPADALVAGDGADAALILVDGAAQQLPEALLARLAEGGRIVGGIVERGVTRLAVGTKVGDAVAMLPVADLGMPQIGEFAAPQRWSF